MEDLIEDVKIDAKHSFRKIGILSQNLKRSMETE